MFGTHDLALFIVSGILLNLVPGPDSLLIMARGAGQGWRAGSAAALGIGAGTCIHILAAALGLSALLATSAEAFTVVKYIGAAYLVYVGLAMLFSKDAPATLAVAGPEAPGGPALPHRGTYRRIFAQGFLTNVLNPKVALFFLAFVPQFIDRDAPNTALAFIFLGCIFNFNSMIWCNFLAVSSSFAGSRVKVSKRVSLWLKRTTGVLFVSFGARLALADAKG